MSEKAVVLGGVRITDSTPPPQGRGVRYGSSAAVNNERKTDCSFRSAFTLTAYNYDRPFSELEEDPDLQLWAVSPFHTSLYNILKASDHVGFLSE